MVDINRMNSVLNRVVDQLAQNDGPNELRRAKDILHKNLQQLGQYARTEYLQENFYTIMFLESYSIHCYYYAATLVELGHYEEAEDIGMLAAHILPSYNEEFFDECDRVVMRALLPRRKLPGITSKQILQMNPPNVKQAIKQLQLNLDKLP